MARGEGGLFRSCPPVLGLGGGRVKVWKPKGSRTDLLCFNQLLIPAGSSCCSSVGLAELWKGRQWFAWGSPKEGEISISKIPSYTLAGTISGCPGPLEASLLPGTFQFQELFPEGSLFLLLLVLWTHIFPLLPSFFQCPYFLEEGARTSQLFWHKPRFLYFLIFDTISTNTCHIC